MKEAIYVLIDMSKGQPKAIVLCNDTIYEEYPLDRRYCTKEYLRRGNLLPKETEYIVCVTPEQENCKAIFSQWESALHSAIQPRECLYRCTQYSIEDALPVATIDRGSAVLLGMASSEQYQNISLRTGILLLYAGEYRTAVLGMYRAMIYSAFGFCSALVEKNEVRYALEQFRNRWLPEEEIQDMGGCGSIFTNDIPEEAIFSTTYCIGTKVKKYEGLAVHVAESKAMEYIQCSASLLVEYMK